MEPSHRFATIDLLRGVAAMIVCWFHLTKHSFVPDGGVKVSGRYGWLGVEVFFVISGFIIPFTLHRARYRLSNYGTFLCKRIIRLDPPYLATVVLIVAMGVLSSHLPGFHGPPFVVTLPQLFAHLGYANVIFGYE